MRKLISLHLFLVLAIAASAQVQRGLQGNYNLDSYPSVSFVWNTACLDELDSSRFTLLEDGKPVSFKVSALPEQNAQPFKKSILILWEDMASHGGQTIFTRRLLSAFLNEPDISGNDRFNVAVFNRKHNTDKSSVMLLSDNFTSDSRLLTDAVESYHSSAEFFSAYPQQSDLYLAINDGIEILQKEPSDVMGVIVVVSAGLNMKASGSSTEMETVKNNALHANIPIYYVNYPLAGNAPEMALLSQATHGFCVSTNSVDEAFAFLSGLYHDMDNNLRGKDYRFTFTANSERDGKSHPVHLSLDKVRQPLPPYQAPGLSVGMWLAKYWWAALSALILIAGGIAIAIVSVRKKNREREQESRDIQDKMLREHEESERRSREAVEAMRREQQAKEQAERDAAERSKAAAEEERLERLMQTKNLFPRLQCMAGTASFAYTVGKPNTTIGRNSDNDVAFSMSNDSFNSQTVSGHHADIVFNGIAFEVVNRSQTYSQGILINGELHQRHTLGNGDIIGLGDAVIKFCI